MAPLALATFSHCWKPHPGGQKPISHSGGGDTLSNGMAAKAFGVVAVVWKVFNRCGVSAGCMIMNKKKEPDSASNGMVGILGTEPTDLEIYRRGKISLLLSLFPSVATCWPKQKGQCNPCHSCVVATHPRTMPPWCLHRLTYHGGKQRPKATTAPPREVDILFFDLFHVNIYVMHFFVFLSGCPPHFSVPPGQWMECIWTHQAAPNCVRVLQKLAEDVLES